MDIDPDRFYDYDHDDFWLKFDGWIEGLAYEESLLRYHAGVIISQCSMAKRPKSIRELWPDRKKKKKGVDDKIRKQLEKFREVEATKKALEKLNNGATGKGRG
jgi:hypothetical protein